MNKFNSEESKAYNSIVLIISIVMILCLIISLFNPKEWLDFILRTTSLLMCFLFITIAKDKVTNLINIYKNK